LIKIKSNRLLMAKALWKSYGGKAVVRGITLTLSGGEIVGLVGPNGAGKTTTVGMLYGIVLPDRGEVTLGEWDMGKQGPSARRSMGIVTQENNLDPDLSVCENLQYFMSHYHVYGKCARTRTEQLLERVGLSAYADYAISELSGGLMRRLVLARSLLHQPEFLFLDEPTTGLDPEARQDFWQLILELRDEGHAILLTTHYMEEAERLCNRIALIRDGEIVNQGSPQQLISGIAGEEVIETEGLAAEDLQSITTASARWIRPVGAGFAFSASSELLGDLIREIELRHPLRIVRRRANLDDVFFLLTGEKLG
jgi:lipooligosaccharide transport system ATP-binding protein